MPEATLQAPVMMLPTVSVTVGYNTPVLVMAAASAAQGKYAAFGRINIRVDLSFEGLGMRLRTKDITVLESVSGALPCPFVDAECTCVYCVGPFRLLCSHNCKLETGS